MFWIWLTCSLCKPIPIPTPSRPDTYFALYLLILTSQVVCNMETIDQHFSCPSRLQHCTKEASCILFYFIFLVQCFPMQQLSRNHTLRQKLILSAQNMGSNFEPFILTTDDSTRGKFVRTHGLCISYTLYAPALNPSIIHVLQQ